MLEAVKVTLDPTPRQERLLESHAGAARFAYNKGLAHVRDVLERGDAPEWSYYALRKWWNQAKDALAVDEAAGEPWWPEKAAGWGSRASSPRTPAFGASRIRPARSAPSTMTHTR